MLRYAEKTMYQVAALSFLLWIGDVSDVPVHRDLKQRISAEQDVDGGDPKQLSRPLVEVEEAEVEDAGNDVAEERK